MSRMIDADALLADCKLVQKGAKDLGCEYASSFYSSSMELSTEWWCVEDLIENAPTIEPERKKGEFKDIELLSELRARFSCFDEEEEPYYRALSKAIAALNPEIKTGKWIHKPNIHGVTYCSECDFELHINNTNYCPNCGKKMEID